MQDNPLTSLTDEDIVLTVNRRLAHDLVERYDQLQIAQGKTVWRAPTILPFNSWLIDKANGYVLPEHFAQMLWQRIIAQSQFGGALICQQQAASEAHTAWKLVHDYQIDISDLHDQHHDVSQIWAQWAQSYKQMLAENNWYDSSTCAQTLSLEAQKKHYFVVGFDRITPLQNTLFTQLKATIVKPLHECVTPSVYALNNTDHEMVTMVQWAKQNSAKKIACVVPNISGRFSELASEFNKQGCPANIAASIALSEYPIVAVALIVLKACTQTVDFDEYSSILRSPFLVAQFEKDCQIREHCAPTIDIKSIEKVEPPARDLQSTREWANYFLTVLEQFQWPGKRTLTSAELQTKKRFEECFTTLACSELLQDQCTQAQAVDLLHYLASSTNFQPQSEDTNVQVMGLLETAGLRFDAIWLMGMNDETLPEPLVPNAFLPVGLQRTNKLPRSEANTEIGFAKKIVERLCGACDEMIVSYAQFDGDREMALSPLFYDERGVGNWVLNQVQDDEKENERGVGNLIQDPGSNATIPLKTQLDNQAPCVTDNEKIRGGSYIVKAQGACPFKAFAEIRLQATPLQEPTSGIQAFERGNIVHTILENIWTEIKTHAQLLTFTNEQIEQHITRVFDNLPTSAAFKIEQQRVKRVITKWLAYEKERPPFSVVAVEQQQNATIAGLTINMRIDRVDQLADGTHAIIDYKTGKTDIKNWFGERPLEPQLPLYCLLDEQVSTITFASVRLADCTFNGVSQAPSLIPDTKNATKFVDSWSDLTNTWRANITDLITQFLAGDARVDPKDGITTCQYCACHPLCRIQ